VLEKITWRRNAKAEKRVCFPKEDTTPPSVTEGTHNSMTATQIGDGPVVYPVVVVEVKGIKCRALLDSDAGSSYASATLLERIGTKPHHSGLHKIEMMLGASSRVMEVYRIKLN